MADGDQLGHPAGGLPEEQAHGIAPRKGADLRLRLDEQLARATEDEHGPLRAADSEGAWRLCRVLEASSLLQELVAHLPLEPGHQVSNERERCIAHLVQDELAQARPVRLGVDLPRDKRLRALCESVLENPARWVTLDDAARHVGASARTIARLFRAELDTTFVQWRQQVLLARALSMAARKLPMSMIAAELGYASASAFSAMVKRSVGMSPSRLLG